MAHVKAPVIIVVIGSANCRWPSALFELIEAATRIDSDGVVRNDVGLPLPAVLQVIGVDGQLGAHTRHRTDRYKICDSNSIQTIIQD